MVIDAWLPVGYELPSGAKLRVALAGGLKWQIYQTQGNTRVLVAHDKLVQRWLEAGLTDAGFFDAFHFGSTRLWALHSGLDQTLSSVLDGAPATKSEALSFALALKLTRAIDPDSPLQDALYCERITRLLPTYGINSRVDDDLVLGYWLTGGVRVSAKALRSLHQAMGWLELGALQDVVRAAGFDIDEVVLGEKSGVQSSLTHSLSGVSSNGKGEPSSDTPTGKIFVLAGRSELAAFFNEHIVDIVQNRDRYSALGIDFPSAVILHGPPGCGKTYAVDKLVDFLGWPSFHIDASSVASPYIHETSKKVAEMFEKAMQSAPSVLVIDEMEAFLADRDLGSGHHRVEEVAEFLRRIPGAIQNDVLIIAMTNRIDMIDPAILRRGRFDHIVEVDYASEPEILSLLESQLATLPVEEGIDLSIFSSKLSGRPLSDVAFVVREGARLAARSGKEKLDQESLLLAMSATPDRSSDVDQKRRIGFV